MILDSIRASLLMDLPTSSIAKSSHWEFHTRQAEISTDSKISGIDGFSNRTRKFPGSTSLHKRNLRKLYPWATKQISSTDFEQAIQICHAQSREIDTCVARHMFTIEMLENFKGISHRRVCVVGDGQSNFVSLALSRYFCDKLISINLTEVLLSDLDLLENIIPLAEDEIAVARTPAEVVEFLNSSRQKLLLISAQNSSIVSGLNIELFVNIASFQEMTPALVQEYFKIIKSNNAYLYCCNRVEKRLYGGEINRFFEFPWGESVILMDEPCKWHQYSYSLRSPQLYKRFPFDGEIWHRLVKF
jgi:hypothetical protein